MTGPLLQAWASDVREHPAVHHLVAAFVGFKPKAETPTTEAVHPSIAMIKAMYPDGIVRG